MERLRRKLCFDQHKLVCLFVAFFTITVLIVHFDTVGLAQQLYAIVNAELENAAEEFDLPPILLKAIAYQESHWHHFGYNPQRSENKELWESGREKLIEFLKKGDVWDQQLESAFDLNDLENHVSLRVECVDESLLQVGLGIMQVTIAVNDNTNNLETIKQLIIDPNFNIREGAKILIEKWKLSQEPTKATKCFPADDSHIIENWWYATYFYNGTGDTAKNYAERIVQIVSDPESAGVPEGIRAYMNPIGWTSPWDRVYGIPGFELGEYFSARETDEGGKFVYFCENGSLCEKSVPIHRWKDLQASRVVVPIGDTIDDYEGKITQEFANYLSTYQGHTYNGYHGGEDIGLSAGTPVRAIAPGYVVKISDLGALGKLVAIKHRGTFVIPAKSATVNEKTYGYDTEWVTSVYSVYVHIQEDSNLILGRYVEEGQEIGTVAELPDLGAHLHFEIRHPDQDPSCDWSLVGEPDNWSTFPGGGYNGYYEDPQLMVEAGLRDPSEFLKANSLPPLAIDVYLVVDLTASFSDDLPSFKIQAANLISNLQDTYPNIRFGLGAFEDYPIGPFGDASCGDRAYYRMLDLTTDRETLVDPIQNLYTKCGADGPESQLAALYQAATGEGQDLSGAGYPEASIPAGQQATFRKDAFKIIILWTDAPFHRPGDPGDIPYPGPSFTETIAALLKGGVIAVPGGLGSFLSAEEVPGTSIKVIGISSGTGAVDDLKKIASATGALAPPGGVDYDGDGVIDIPEGEPLVCPIASTGEGIADAIVAAVKAIAKFEYSNLTVSPQVVFPGETVTVSAEVRNVGEVAGTDAVELRVDGEVRDTKIISLDPGEVTTVQFQPIFSEAEIGEHLVTIDGLSSVAVSVVTDTTPPPAPTISSPTHPDQDEWYNNNDPTFNWTEPDDPSGIAGYSFVLDQTADTTPDETVDTTERTKSYTGIADGIWYFHVRAQDGAGNWGPASHYRIKIRAVFPTAEITFPEDGAAIRATVNITGSASGDDFDYYMVEYGEGENPSTWTLLFSSREPVTQGTLATWDTTQVSEGQYTIRLTVVDAYTYVVQVAVTVIVDNTPPVIQDVLPIEGDFVPAKPTITATLTDNLSGIDEDSILVKLNGNEVDPAPSFDPDTGKMTWTAQDPLPDGTYEVTLDVKDKAGNAAEQARTSFTVQTELAIAQVLNYPNPCSSGTTFTYNLSQEAQVRIEIYTLAGELIKVIDPASGEVGYNQQYWDGLDDRGKELGNGVYLYRIVAQAGGKITQAIGRLVILR